MSTDRAAMDRFWGFIRARHGAYYARHVIGGGPPWTDDAIVANNFFTNVYRELDPGTREIRYHLPWATGLREAVFWAVAYRLAFNENSFGALREADLLYLKAFPKNSSEVRARLREMHKPFTPAYVVSNYGRKGSKIDVIIDVLVEVARRLRDCWPGIVHIKGRAGFHRWCTDNLWGIGKFVAFQAMVDLCYPRTRYDGEHDRGWLPWSNDGWVVAGPGAEKGLRILHPDMTVNQRTSGEMIDNLADKGQIALDGMPGWDNDTTVHVDRSNLQNCCCEFSKYERIRTGGRGKRRFRPQESRARDMEAQGHGKQMEM